MTEFMNCYAEMGMKHYVGYREFYHKYEFPQSVTLAIVIGYQGGTTRGRFGKTTESFRRGEFIFKKLEEAEDRAEKIMMLKNIYYGYKKGLFVSAMLRLFRFEDYNHSEFISKLKQQLNRLTDIEPSTVNGFLRIFEDIYNFRRQGKKVSFYQDLKRANGK